MYTKKKEGTIVKIQSGYLYHIKDEFFEKVNDETLMKNYELGKKRPTYFTIKEKKYYGLFLLVLRLINIKK